MIAKSKVFQVFLLLLCVFGASPAQAQTSVYNTPTYKQYKAVLPSFIRQASDGYAAGCRQQSRSGWQSAARKYRQMATFHRQYAGAFQRMAAGGSVYQADAEARRQLNYANNAESNARRMDAMARQARR